jgi:glycosyltransferase involved in cell wall biosynthesis
MAHRCALLSRVNPDNVTARFGYHVEDDDFAGGLADLLEGDAWREKGEAGYHYVRNLFELGNVMEKHLEAYRDLLRG